MPVSHSKSPPDVSHPFWNLSIIQVMSSINNYASSASRSRGLRSSKRGNFVVIRTNLKFGNRAFSVAGHREWNSLPVSVRQCTSVAQFKSKLNTHLFSLYYDYECSITRFRARLVLLKRDINAQLYCIVI